MTISDNLNRIINAKANIKQAIENKGVIVSDSALLDEYPALISSIEVGGSGEGGGDPYYENLHNQRTDNGTNFSYYFYYYPASELDVSKLDTSKATNMNSMFMNNYSLTSINGIENMNVSNVSNMNSMFDTCYVTSLDLSNWDMKNVTNINRMFSNCSSLTSLNVSGWDMKNVTSLDSMFASCGIQTLDLSSWDVSNVTNMYYLFACCYNLTTVNFSGWDTSKVENMGDMFNGCNDLTSLDLSNFDTSNVTNMDSMFSYMQSYDLPKIDLSSFTTKKLQQAYYMFNWCIALQELDIRNFELVHEDGTEVAISSMLEGCNNLHILRLDNCSNATIRKIINESGMPQEPYYDGNISEYINRIIYCKEENAAGLTAPNGWEFVFVTDEPEVPEEPETPEEEIPLYVLDEFRGNSEITEVRTMVNESHTDLSNMFYNCKNLVSVNTEDWDTGNVTTMNDLFSSCTSLMTLNLSNWNVSNVTRMWSMFENCTSLTILDLSNWDLSHKPGTISMLYNCTSLHTLRLDNCNYDTIERILSSSISTNAIEGVTRTIYCKEANLVDEFGNTISAPTNWEFSFVE